mmetsp:Transcript_25067/g.46455  ORF Transcript_25067/g.46455 Transcript_25067/m.46455 type:complete len:114 (-) Transcript_25067:437-778(-)
MIISVILEKTLGNLCEKSPNSAKECQRVRSKSDKVEDRFEPIHARNLNPCLGIRNAQHATHTNANAGNKTKRKGHACNKLSLRRLRLNKKRNCRRANPFRSIHRIQLLTCEAV